MVAQVAQARRLVLEVERRHADQVEAGVVEAVAGVEGAFDGRNRRPELLVEVAPEMEAPLFVEPLHLPAVDRPVGERIALGRPAAEGPRPGAGVAEVEVEEDAVGVESDQGARHGGTLAKPKDGRCPAKDGRGP